MSMLVEKSMTFLVLDIWAYAVSEHPPLPHEKKSENASNWFFTVSYSFSHFGLLGIETATLYNCLQRKILQRFFVSISVKKESSTYPMPPPLPLPHLSRIFSLLRLDLGWVLGNWTRRVAYSPCPRWRNSACRSGCFRKHVPRRSHVFPHQDLAPLVRRFERLSVQNVLKGARNVTDLSYMMRRRGFDHLCLCWKFFLYEWYKTIIIVHPRWCTW